MALFGLFIVIVIIEWQKQKRKIDTEIDTHA
jgi:hypothetical protein